MEQRPFSVLVLSVLCMFIFGAFVFPQVGATFFDARLLQASVSVAIDNSEVDTGDAPVIVLQPETQTLSSGGQVVMRVDAVGTGPITYQWYKDGNLMEGAEDAELYLSSALDTGTYFAKVSNSAGTAISNVAVMRSVLPTMVPQQIAPVITDGLIGGSPFSVGEKVSIGTGDYLYIAVDAGGSQLRYEWYKDGVMLPQYIGNEIWIPEASASDLGVYQVKVVNSVGSALSNSIVVSAASFSQVPGSDVAISP